MTKQQKVTNRYNNTLEKTPRVYNLSGVKTRDKETLQIDFSELNQSEVMFFADGTCIGWIRKIEGHLYVTLFVNDYDKGFVNVSVYGGR